MTLFEAIGSVLSKYGSFAGRARRSEYWWFALANAVVMNILSAVLVLPNAEYGVVNGTYSFHAEGPGVLIWLLLGLALFLPGLAVTVRRLHDTGTSGGFIFIWLVPVIGWILLLVRLIKEGDSGPNQYGPDPRA